MPLRTSRSMPGANVTDAPSRSRRGGRARRLAGLVVLLSTVAGCGEITVDDPLAELARTDVNPRIHHKALEITDATPTDPARLEILHGMIWRPGYLPQVREAALERLERVDLENLKRTIRQRLPRLSAIAWHRRLCEIIAERGWIELSPALASSWARQVGLIDLRDAPEHAALAHLHGEERVVDVIFDLMVTSKAVHEQGLRTRCWSLLHRLGQRQRVLDLLEGAELDADDLMMHDLRAGAVELGIVPVNREEILWMRRLREPERRDFRERAAAVVAGLAPERRAGLELRDLPILVAASIHEPELVHTTQADLYQRVDAYVRSTKRYIQGRSYEGFVGTYEQRLHDHRDRLTWGDLAAMLMALRAMEVPEVVQHLFDYAERDRLDKSTEYGGVIRLDEPGRFEILEFPPRIRFADNRFQASQAMFDAGYEALFHFHYHAQKHDNDDFAGPGLGDVVYSDQTRANCLVLTFVNSTTMNVDFYRYDRVIVDLGEIRRR